MHEYFLSSYEEGISKGARHTTKIGQQATMPAQASFAMLVSHIIQGEEVRPQPAIKSAQSALPMEKAKARPAQNCKVDAAGVYDVYSGSFWSTMVDLMPN